ncbi:MAG TPA: hypothetical protein PK156_21085 [Polyangium sp.]|nr:hypothetical protein [Polyangium sp.]
MSSLPPVAAADLLLESMRLGIIGPAKGDVRALAHAVECLLDVVGVQRVLYLASDGTFDILTRAWARYLVGNNPSEESLFERAALRCANAAPEAIEAFVAAERARIRLRALSCLPEGNRRTVDFFDGRVALFMYDKSILDEDDVVGATIFVYGRSNEPKVKRIGTRMFVTPGPLAGPQGGLLVLGEGPSGGVRVEIRNLDGSIFAEEMLGGTGSMLPGIKMRVQGGNNAG